MNEKVTPQTLEEGAPDPVEEVDPLDPGAAPEPTPDPRDQEIADLKAKNERMALQLANPPAPSAQPVQVTSAGLRALSDAQWAPIEEQHGQERGEIIAAVERKEIMDSNTATHARLNVQDAIESEIEKDPTVSKLKGGIKEYMADVPIFERADPARVAVHMKKAKIYARGLAAGQHPTPPAPVVRGGKQVTVPTPTPGPAGGDAPDISEEGAVKPGSEIVVGKLRLRVSDRASDELRSRTKHPDDPNGVMFKHFDEKPKFNRGGGGR